MMWRAMVQTMGVWWRDVIDFAFLNVLWIGCSITIIGAAPALAAMHQLAVHATTDDYVDWRTFFRAFRQHALPAWRWGLLQLAVYGVIAVNLLYYAEIDGLLIDILRVLWITGLAIWSCQIISIISQRRPSPSSSKRRISIWYVFTASLFCQKPGGSSGSKRDSQKKAAHPKRRIPTHPFTTRCHRRNSPSA